MDELVNLLQDSLPNVSILLTTLPVLRKFPATAGRRRTYCHQSLARQQRPVETISGVMPKNTVCWHGICIDVVGGKRRACTTDWKPNPMCPDHVLSARGIYPKEISITPGSNQRL